MSLCLLWEADWQDGVDMGLIERMLLASLPGTSAGLGVLAATGWLVVPSLKRSSTWWAGRVVPHNHCRLDTAALKWDPPLMQLSDWLLNYRPSIIILFFFFFPPRGRYLQNRALGLGVLAAAALPPYMCGS